MNENSGVVLMVDSDGQCKLVEVTSEIRKEIQLWRSDWQVPGPHDNGV